MISNAGRVGRDGDQEAGSRFTKRLVPERDLALNWTIDVASVLDQYLDQLHGTDASLQDGLSLNFVEAALVVQGSAGIYSRKTDYLHSLVLQTLTAITTGATKDRSNDGEESGDGQGDDDGGDGDECDVHKFLSLDGVEVVGTGTGHSRLEMREKDQRKASDGEEEDDEAGLADAAAGARQGSKLAPRAPPILLTVEEELDGGRSSSTVSSSELSSFKMSGFVSHISGSILLEAQDGDVLDVLLRLPRSRARFLSAMSPGSAAFSFPHPGLSPDRTPPLPGKGARPPPYAEQAEAVAEGDGQGGCAQWGEGAARPSDWQGADDMGMGMGMGMGEDDDDDGMGAAGGFGGGDWAEAAAGGADGQGSHAEEWGGEATGSGGAFAASGAGSSGLAGSGGVAGPAGQSGGAQNKSGSRGASGKGSASGRGRGREEAAADYDPFAPLDPDDAGCAPLRPLRKGRPYLRAKQKVNSGDWTSSLSDPCVSLSFPLLTGKGRGMILPFIETIIQRAVARESRRQRRDGPGGSAERVGSHKVASALEPPSGNVFADLEAECNGAYGEGSHGNAAAAAGVGDGHDGMDVVDDDGGDGAGMEEGDSDEEGGEDGVGVEQPRCGASPHASPLPGMEWGDCSMNPDKPLPDGHDSAKQATTVEAMRDAHMAEMLQRAAAVQARKSAVEKRVGDWQSRILPILEQQDERPPFDIHVYGDRILSALEQKQMQQEQQEAIERGEVQGLEEDEQQRQHQQRVCEDLFENVINTPDAYEVPRYFSAMLQLVNNGNVSLSVDPHASLQPSCVTFSHPPSSSSSLITAHAPPAKSAAASSSTSSLSTESQCFSRGSSFSVRLQSSQRRQVQLQGYVAPSQQGEGGSERGGDRRKGKEPGVEGLEGEAYHGEESAGVDAAGGGGGRGDGRPGQRDSGGSKDGSKDGTAAGGGRRGNGVKKRKARDRELPPRPPASRPARAVPFENSQDTSDVPSSSLWEQERLAEEEQVQEERENGGCEGAGQGVTRSGGNLTESAVLTESRRGVNQREDLQARAREKGKMIMDESREEGEVEEEWEPWVFHKGTGLVSGRGEGSGVNKEPCQNSKRQRQDGTEDQSSGGSGLGTYSNRSSSSQRCGDAVRGASAAAGMMGTGKAAASPVPVARKRDPKSTTLLRKFVAARLERTRSWKERLSLQRTKQKLGGDCMSDSLFSVRWEHAEFSKCQKRRRECEQTNASASRAHAAIRRAKRKW